MNKAFALAFLAIFATVGVSNIEAFHHQKWFVRPGPWIPLNIPLPKPPGQVVVPPQQQTCPTAPQGCLTCGTADATKCTTTEGTIGACFTGPCPAACTGTACVVCAAGCTP